MLKNRFKVYFPIICMGILFVLGIVLALVLSPVFIQMNAKADFSELGGMNEESVMIIVIYIAAMLIFTAIILLIGRAKKGRFIKYIIIFVVGLTIVYTFGPLLGYAVNGPIVQIWDENAEIDKPVTFVTKGDILGDGRTEVVFGTRDGNIYAIDSKSHDTVFHISDMNSSITSITILDIDSNNGPELMILSYDNLDIYRFDGYGNRALIFSNNSGEISDYTYGDIDNDGWQEIWLSTRLGAIKTLGWNGELTAQNIQYLELPLSPKINDSINAVQLLQSVPGGAFDTPVLLVGTADGFYIYNAADGTVANGSENGDLGYLTNPVKIEVVDLDPATAELIGGRDRVLMIYTKSKTLTIMTYADFNLINQIPDVREFGSMAVEDILEEYQGDELILNGDGQLLLVSSGDTLWDDYKDISSLIYDLDGSGSGAAVADLARDGAPELVLGTGSGFTYGELNVPGSSNIPCYTSAFIALVFIVLLFRYPEWYVVDTAGMIIGAGVCTIIGISIAILPILIFLIALAVYDAISVYKTKHMIDLADNVMDMKLPIVLVIPKKLSYSFIKQKRLKDQLAGKEEREAMFMGLGDVIIPGTLVVSAFTFLPGTTIAFDITGNMLVAICTLIGAMVGFFVLMRFVLKGNPQAGLPLLNSGAILGFVISYLLIYQDLSFGIGGVG